MVGDALLSAKASGDLGGQVRMLEMLGNGFNEGKRYGRLLRFSSEQSKQAVPHPIRDFLSWRMKASRLP